MKRLVNSNIAAGIILVIVAAGCRHAANVQDQVSHPGIPVTVSSIHIGPMVRRIEMNATSIFLFKAAIKAPAAGFIDNVMITQGEAVAKNQVLFAIRTKEASALAGDSIKDLAFSGKFNVRAATNGLISSIEHPLGDYVGEGDLLCQVAIPESFAFILDVPFELSGFVKVNAPCRIILPDSTALQGTIITRLPSMARNSQTERFVVKLKELRNLPENLTAKISITRDVVKEANSLPKSCILADETMQQFWVMKLINDSIAVKVPVETGINEDEYVQITRPSFKPSDLFLASGNFGLGDTAYVKVINYIGHEQ